MKSFVCPLFSSGAFWAPRPDFLHISLLLVSLSLVSIGSVPVTGPGKVVEVSSWINSTSVPSTLVIVAILMRSGGQFVRSSSKGECTCSSCLPLYKRSTLAFASISIALLPSIDISPTLPLQVQPPIFRKRWPVGNTPLMRWDHSLIQAGAKALRRAVLPRVRVVYLSVHPHSP